VCAERHLLGHDFETHGNEEVLMRLCGWLHSWKRCDRCLECGASDVLWIAACTILANVVVHPDCPKDGCLVLTNARPMPHAPPRVLSDQ